MSRELRNRILLLSLVVGAGALALAVLLPPGYRSKKRTLPATFDEYLKEKLRISHEKGARPGNEERLIRYADKTEFAILYIHGYGASRAEGELVVDQLAEKFKANTYYVRLPGHGTNPEDHAQATFSDYINEVEDAYQMTRLLGDRVIIVGTSMGGLLATYLGSRHPEIDGLILTSPFYDFEDWLGRLANEPGAMYLLETVNGSAFRKTEKRPDDPNDKRIEGYQDFWYTKQYLKAIKSLEDLREYAANSGTYERLTMPVLLLYYYKDEQHKDQTASVPAMLDAFHQFGMLDKPNPLNRAVAIERGNHVLLSRWVDADYDRSLQEMVLFVNAVKSRNVKK
ncbi:MAG: alpha/beta fold hydrolase [Leptonema illini]|uniref:Alpha/beta fold hydrolase n=1 Tax=Leptonema illini TaxID=183 RepID=A0A833LXE0_9LEPT|nr:MAG: alpha/beta fold hydrolase [Leptonema illini]